MNNKPFILVVEDDRPIRHFMTVALEAQGYQCLETQTGNAAIALAMSHNPDIILLDLGLPDMDGKDVIHKIRPFTKAGIIVVSARGHEREKAEALDCGADDYLTKPFSVVELLARIRVAIRHLRPELKMNEVNQGNYQIGELFIDVNKYRVSIAGGEVHLTPIEFKIMALMAVHAGRVLTHHFILSQIWGEYTDSDRQSLRVFMGNIRRKIEIEPAQPRYILTEVGVGYRLVDE